MENNIFNFSGKKILVTGASSGIGREIAVFLSSLGAQCVITGRNEERLLKTVDEIKTVSKGNVNTFFFDFLNTDKIPSFVDGLPILDGAVLNAGVSKVVPVKFIEEKDCDDIIKINTVSQILLFKELLKQRKLKKSSSIVFISSVAGLGENAIGTSLYSASKSAICGFAKGAALEVANKSIRVNTVCPGKVNTKILDSLENLSPSEQEGIKQYPLGRYGEPCDISNAVVFLLSDASTWITGIDLIVDGGLHLKR